MSLDRTELWTAAGVIVAALVGGSAFGYYFGKDSAEFEINALEKNLSVHEAASSIDALSFLARIQEIDTSMGKKEALSQKNNELEQTIKNLNSQNKNLSGQLNSSKGTVSKLKNDLEKLNALIRKDYSALEQFVVKENEATWVIPNEVAVSMSQSMNNSAHLTITDALDGGWVDLGERVKLNLNGENCSVVPTEFLPVGLAVSLICKDSE